MNVSFVYLKIHTHISIFRIAWFKRLRAQCLLSKASLLHNKQFYILFVRRQQLVLFQFSVYYGKPKWIKQKLEKCIRKSIINSQFSWECEATKYLQRSALRRRCRLSKLSKYNQIHRRNTTGKQKQNILKRSLNVTDTKISNSPRENRVFHWLGSPAVQRFINKPMDSFIVTILPKFTVVLSRMNHAVSEKIFINKIWWCRSLRAIFIACGNNNKFCKVTNFVSRRMIVTVYARWTYRSLNTIAKCTTSTSLSIGNLLRLL